MPLPLAQITHEETVPVFVLNMQTSSHSIDKRAPGEYVNGGHYYTWHRMLNPEVAPIFVLVNYLPRFLLLTGKCTPALGFLGLQTHKAGGPERSRVNSGQPRLRKGPQGHEWGCAGVWQ